MLTPSFSSCAVKAWKEHGDIIIAYLNHDSHDGFPIVSKASHLAGVFFICLSEEEYGHKTQHCSTEERKAFREEP